MYELRFIFLGINASSFGLPQVAEIGDERFPNTYK
jgi:hypothetical protein